MKTTCAKTLGWSLVVLGVVVVLFSPKIVFPGLERLVGIETIVGKQNVVYQDDGGYLFTNPGAMIRWIVSVVASGVILCVSGVLLVVRARRKQSRLSTNQQTSTAPE